MPKRTTLRRMTTTPTPGSRTSSICLPGPLAAYVDQQSARFGISKAGFIRQLIAKDREAQVASRSVG
jgi:hypothetical protein